MEDRVPRIEVAREAGACYGVERALKIATETAAQAEGPVHTLGPLIHNPTVVSKLERAGVTVVDDPKVGAGATLLLRTHGVTPQVEDAARASGATVLDATCPYVKKCHLAAERLSREGYQVLVVGEAGHPEVEGTMGHVPGALVAGSAADVERLDLKRRVGLVVQTTLARDTLREVVGALIGRVEDLKVIDTICEATSTRQAAADELSRRADVMVVIGGHNSANTTHLAQICEASCAHTYHIETADELVPEWFVGTALVGVTAGASTPRYQIEEVRAAIEQLASL